MTEYLLFTLPNCDSCEAMKEYISGTSLDVTEYRLTQKESKIKIREFLSLLKRDDSGAILLPTLVIKDEKEIKTVLNSHEELDNWLKLKA